MRSLGAPGGNRTPDPQLRRLLLYPTELLARYEAKVSHYDDSNQFLLALVAAAFCLTQIETS